MRALAGLLGVALALTACGKSDPPTSTSTSTSTSTPTSTPTPTPTPTATPTFDTSIVAAMFSDAGLTAREQTELTGALTHFDAPCPSVAVSVAQCLAEHRACPDCELAARYVAIGVRSGWPHQYTEMAYQSRFEPDGAKTLPVDGSPTKGPDSAPITIVEFGSYVCPHCAAEAPKLDALLKQHPKDVRLVFKPAWSPANPAVVPPSRAALAAGQQGKFWEMHALLFANQPKFETADLDGYAAQLGLDVAKLHADMQGSKVADQMARDLTLMKTLGVDSLPAIFINGRPYLPFEDFEQRIAFELAGQKKPR